MTDRTGSALYVAMRNHLSRFPLTLDLWVYASVTLKFGGVSQEERERWHRVAKYLEKRMCRGLS